MPFKSILFSFSLLASGSAWAGSYTQTNLVSDGAVPAAVTDPNLKNAWGLSYAPNGPFWVSDNATGLSTVYDGSGAIQPAVVTIPAATTGATGTPSGQAYNPGTGFVIKANGTSGPATFLFVTEDGTISGWNPTVDASSAILAVNASASNAVFKGAALVPGKSGADLLFVTDFYNGVVDVFDARFKLKFSFRDKMLPANYAPYGIAYLNKKIYITYAVQDAAKHDSVSGAGLGAVDEVDVNGVHVLRRAAHGFLNAPWGLALAPKGFGAFGERLLVGNFGDGHITAYAGSGTALTPLAQVKGSSGKAIAINGLWGLIAGNSGANTNPQDVYFSAGPNNEADGLFGSLSYNP